MSPFEHKRLFLPGPVEVRREILDAQAAWMIGHRTADFAELFARLQGKLKRAFFTDSRVFVSGSSGSGLWEGAVRCGIRDGRKVLHLTGGAFSERWADISRANGVQRRLRTGGLGESAYTPEMVAAALDEASYDAVCAVHNETSTGVTNPIREIGAVVNEHDDTLFFVDTVSGFLGTELRVDEWGIDIALTSSQKAFALPPGIAFAAVSDRLLERAQTIAHRGYYFDFLTLEKSLQKNNTPATPPIALMFAADMQMDAILAEGIEARWARHRAMRDATHEWALARRFGLYAQEGYRSDTVTTVANTLNIDVNAMGEFMENEIGFAIDKGYGNIKGATFRLPHMGDVTLEMLREVLDGIDAFMAQARLKGATCMTYHVLVPDNVHQKAIEIIDASEGISFSAPGKLERDALLEAMADAHALIIRSGVKADAELIGKASGITSDRARRRRRRQCRSGGGDCERGIVVMNTPGGNTISTAEHAFGLMIALSRHIAPGHQSLAEGRWDRKAFSGVELKGKTLGIIGLGRIGQAIATRAQAFEMTVIAHDPYLPSAIAEVDPGSAAFGLDEVYARADYLTLHALVTDETRGMINAETIATMKDWRAHHQRGARRADQLRTDSGGGAIERKSRGRGSRCLRD